METLQVTPKRIEALGKIVVQNGANVAITTELAICGYPPRDLLLQPDFIKMAFQRARNLDVKIPLLVGTPTPEEDRQYPLIQLSEQDRSM